MTTMRELIKTLKWISENDEKPFESEIATEAADRLGQLENQLATVTAERDKAVEDLKENSKLPYGGCYLCKNTRTDVCKNCIRNDLLVSNGKLSPDCWQWRGLGKDVERKLQCEIMLSDPQQQRLDFYNPLERLKRIEKELSSAVDNSIFEIFEKYGYSQEQILSLLKENKITRFVNHSCDKEVWQYIVDDNFYLNVELAIIEEPPCGFRMIFRELSAGKVGEANG